MTPTTSPPRRSCWPALCLFVSLLPVAASGQEPQPSPQPSPREAPRSQDADGEKSASEKPAAKASRPSDVFKPSEEISEDLSVPFPVDI